MDATPERFDRLLYAASALAAVGVVLIGIPSQLLHPLPDPDVADSFLHEVTGATSYWTFIHLMAVLSFSLGLVIQFALYRFARGDVARLLATFGFVFGVIGVAFSFTWFVIDGVAVTHVAEDWKNATAADQETAFRVAQAVEDIIFAAFSLMWVVVFGIPVALLGASFALTVPRLAWAGWLGAASGVFSAAVGLTQTYTYRDFVVTDILIPIAAGLSGFWLVGVALWMWRHTRKQAPAPVPRPAPTP